MTIKLQCHNSTIFGKLLTSWSIRRDLNSRPPTWQAGVLATELLMRGADGKNRTSDPYVTNIVLIPLSYKGMIFTTWSLFTVSIRARQITKLTSSPDEKAWSLIRGTIPAHLFTKQVLSLTKGLEIQKASDSSPSPFPPERKIRSATGFKTCFLLGRLLVARE